MRKLLLLAALLAGAVSAQEVAPSDPVPSMALPRSSVGNQSTYTGMTANADNIGKFRIAFASDGTVLFKTGTNHPTPGGGSIPIDVRGSVPKATVAQALGRFLRKGLPIVGTGVALYDLANELDFRLRIGTGGGIEVDKTNPALCTVAPCYEWSSINFTTGLPKWSGDTSGLSACQRIASEGSVWSANYNMAYLSHTATTCVVRLTAKAGGAFVTNSTYQIGSRSRTPDADVPIPSSIAELEAAIAAKSGWPSGSALARAVHDSAKAGEVYSPVVDQVTGPATAPGPSKVTTDTAAGTTTTTGTTYNYTYNDNRVNASSTTTSVVVNTATGAPVGTTTTTDQPETPADDCSKGGGGLNCKELDTPGDQVPTREVSAVFQIEDLGLGGGSCPAPVSFTVTTGTYSLDLTQWCDAVQNIIRPVVLLLAAFASLMIAFPREAV